MWRFLCSEVARLHAVTARGLGETEPAAANQTDDGSDDPEGRALNRRVELTLPDES